MLHLARFVLLMGADMSSRYLVLVLMLFLYTITVRAENELLQDIIRAREATIVLDKRELRELTGYLTNMIKIPSSGSIWTQQNLMKNINEAGIWKGLIGPALVGLDQSYARGNYSVSGVFSTIISKVNPQIGDLLEAKLDLPTTEQGLTALFQNEASRGALSGPQNLLQGFGEQANDIKKSGVSKLFKSAGTISYQDNELSGSNDSTLVDAIGTLQKFGQGAQPGFGQVGAEGAQTGLGINNGHNGTSTGRGQIRHDPSYINVRESGLGQSGAEGAQTGLGINNGDNGTGTGRDPIRHDPRYANGQNRFGKGPIFDGNREVAESTSCFGNCSSTVTQLIDIISYGATGAAIGSYTTGGSIDGGGIGLIVGLFVGDVVYKKTREQCVGTCEEIERINTQFENSNNAVPEKNPAPVQPGPKSNPETGPEGEPKTDPEPEPKTDPEPEPKTDPEPEPKTDPEPEPKTDPEPEPKTDPRPAPECKPADPDCKPNTSVELHDDQLMIDTELLPNYQDKLSKNGQGETISVPSKTLDIQQILLKLSNYQQQDVGYIDDRIV